jgi:hypothetical protein
MGIHFSRGQGLQRPWCKATASPREVDKTPAAALAEHQLAAAARPDKRDRDCPEFLA